MWMNDFSIFMGYVSKFFVVDGFNEVGVGDELWIGSYYVVDISKNINMFCF